MSIKGQGNYILEPTTPELVSESLKNTRYTTSLYGSVHSLFLVLEKNFIVGFDGVSSSLNPIPALQISQEGSKEVKIPNDQSDQEGSGILTNIASFYHVSRQSVVRVDTDVLSPFLLAYEQLCPELFQLQISLYTVRSGQNSINDWIRNDYFRSSDESVLPISDKQLAELGQRVDLSKWEGFSGDLPGSQRAIYNHWRGSCDVIYAISQLIINTKYAFVILDEKATFNEKLCTQGVGEVGIWCVFTPSKKGKYTLQFYRHQSIEDIGPKAPSDAMDFETLVDLALYKCLKIARQNERLGTTNKNVWASVWSTAQLSRKTRSTDGSFSPTRPRSRKRRSASPGPSEWPMTQKVQQNPTENARALARRSISPASPKRTTVVVVEQSRVTLSTSSGSRKGRSREKQERSSRRRQTTSLDETQSDYSLQCQGLHDQSSCGQDTFDLYLATLSECSNDEN